MMLIDADALISYLINIAMAVTILASERRSHLTLTLTAQLFAEMQIFHFREKTAYFRRNITARV